jgi:hypothetical protein
MTGWPVEKLSRWPSNIHFFVQSSHRMILTNGENITFATQWNCNI